jgi:PAS domain S-box-containing protein
MPDSIEILKILIVDDNHNNLFSLRALLEARLREIEVIDADSGERTLEQMQQHEIDLAILDVQMPGMDGFEVAEYMRGRKKTKNIPIVFLTAAYKAEEFQQRGYALGAADYLTKPIDTPQLINRISIYLRFIRQEHQYNRELEQKARLRTAELSTTNARLQAEIQERQAAEKALRQSNQALNDSEQRLQSILATSPIGIDIARRADGKILFANGRAAEMYGYSLDEFIGIYAKSLYVNPEQRGILLEKIAQEGWIRDFELEFVRKDGSRYWALLSMIPTEYQNEPALMVWIYDISERKQAEEAVKRAKEQADAANQAKSVFLANMTHELRTPMNAVLGYAQILERKPELSADVKHVLSVISSSGNSLLQLINEILDLSKIEAGKMELNLTDFDLVALIRELSAMFKFSCEQSGLAWRESLPLAPSLPVRGDEGKLRQILVNLAGNAVKFTERGSVSLEVASLGKDQYRFSLRDTGPGIPAQSLQKIFEPFQQEESGRKKGGTGLGLALSSQQVELMGGQLRVESELGQGSCFYFDLLLPSARAVAQPPWHRYAGVTGLAAGQAAAALVVDDDAHSREILAKMLENIGVAAVLASSGEQALARLGTGALPGIIFMDYRMPGWDGVEATRQIRAAYGDEIKIVMYSASTFDHQRKLYQSCGCQGFLGKPFHAEQVYELLAEVLKVEFEHAEAEPTADIPALAAALPAGLRQRLRECAEFGMLTELKEALAEVARLGEAGVAVAEHCRGLLSSRGSDAIMELMNAAA